MFFLLQLDWDPGDEKGMHKVNKVGHVESHLPKGVCQAWPGRRQRQRGIAEQGRRGMQGLGRGSTYYAAQVGSAYGKLAYGLSDGLSLIPGLLLQSHISHQ